MNWVALVALLRKEILRFAKVWMQTVLSPLVTTALYFVVFGLALGQRLQHVPVGDSEALYIDFVIPGLMMLAMINNAFLNSASSLFQSKINGTISDLLAAPIGTPELLIAYTTAASLRGVIVASLVWITSAVFAGFHVAHPVALVVLASLVAATFALLGLTAAVLSEKFDHLNIVPSFVLTPLTFLGGVFYSATMLPEPWSTIARLNPIFHMVSGMRWALLGVAEIPVATTFGLAAVWFLTALAGAWRVFERSARLRP